MMLVSASHFLFADKVNVDFEFHVGDRVAQGTFVIDSETYLSLSMDEENLGLLIRLASSTKGREGFEIIPTKNGAPFGNFRFHTRRELTFGKGASFNEHVLEKELTIKFLNAEHIEPDTVK